MAENNLFPNAFPRKVYCSPQYSYIRADGMHGWNLAIMEDQEPYRRDTCLKMVTAYNEYDQLKEENKKLRNILKTIEDRSATLDNGVKSDSAADKQIASIWEMAHEVNTILSPSNTETNAKDI